MTANGLKTVVSTNRQTAGMYGWICSARTRLWTEAFGLRPVPSRCTKPSRECSSPQGCGGSALFAPFWKGEFLKGEEKNNTTANLCL